jgi:hypothetical protein
MFSFYNIIEDLVAMHTEYLKCIHLNKEFGGDIYCDIHKEFGGDIYCDIYVPSSLCGLVVRVSGYRSRSPHSISGATRFSEK